MMEKQSYQNRNVVCYDGLHITSIPPRFHNGDYVFNTSNTYRYCCEICYFLGFERGLPVMVRDQKKLDALVTTLNDCIANNDTDPVSITRTYYFWLGV